MLDDYLVHPLTFCSPFSKFFVYDFGLYQVFSCPVARIALVKPEKARGVEDVILRAAQFGQITEKVVCIYTHLCIESLILITKLQFYPKINLKVKCYSDV